MRRFAPLVALLCSCGSLLSKPVAPAGLKCDQLLVPSNSLQDSLAAATAGDCMVLGSGVYTGSFVLPIDASITAAAGATVTLKGDGSSNPVLTVKGGTRSTVRGLRIETAAGGASRSTPARRISSASALPVSGAMRSKRPAPETIVPIAKW